MVELLHQQTELLPEILANFKDELQDLKKDIWIQKDEEEMKKYKKEKAEYDQAWKEYNQKMDAIKKREKSKKILEEKSELRKKGFVIQIVWTWNAGKPQWQNKLTENDIRNKKVKYNPETSQERIKENNKILNRALNFYKSQWLILDYLIENWSKRDNKDNIKETYFIPVFKQPTKPTIKKPIKPKIQKTEPLIEKTKQDLEKYTYIKKMDKAWDKIQAIRMEIRELAKEKDADKLLKSVLELKAILDALSDKAKEVYIMEISEREKELSEVLKSANSKNVKFVWEKEISKNHFQTKFETKEDTNNSGTFMMLDGKKYSYEDLIKNYPAFKNDSIFKKNFPGRERPKEKK